MSEQELTTAGEPMGTRRPVGRPKGRHSTETVDAILDAAERVFGHVGFDGGTLQEVARLSGVTKPTVIYYFGSKEKLYQAVLDRVRKNLYDWLERLENEEGSAVEIIDTGLKGFVRFVTNHRHLARLAVASGSAGVRFDETLVTSVIHPRIEMAIDWLIRHDEIEEVHAATVSHLMHAVYAMTTNYFADIETTTQLLGHDAKTEEAIEEFTNSVRDIVFRTLALKRPMP